MFHVENDYSIVSCKDKWPEGDCKCGHLSRRLISKVGGVHFSEFDTGKDCDHAIEYSKATVAPVPTATSKKCIKSVVGEDATAICLPLASRLLPPIQMGAKRRRRT